MKGPGEATAISEALFDFVGQGISMFDTEDTIMDSVCDLIDFDGDLDIPMEDIKVSPARDAFPPSDDSFMLSKKLKAEPVPMEVDSEPLFWPSYPTPPHRVVVTMRTHSLPMNKFGVSLRSRSVTLASTSLLSWVALLGLSRRSFGTRQELELVVSKSTRGLMSFRVRLVQNLLVSISLSFPPFQS
jgi:hypothetical protein